jgi:CRP/FNR family transcriptional regulator, anaerobic regulatory protein
MDAIPTCADCAVRDRALCGSLSDGELAELNALGRRRHLRRGEALVWAGDESLVCGNLLSGVMKLSASTADGREQIVGLLYPADFVGRPFAQAADFTIAAMSDVELCVFPRGPFERVLADHVRMERLLLQRTFAALDQARGRMLTLGRLSAREKLAGLLLDLAERSGGCRATPSGPLTFDLPLTRGEMAEVLGLTIETVSRQLSAMKAEGAIALMGARGVTIRDPAALAGTEVASRA